MVSSRLRLISAILAVVSLGLLASLLPRTSFVSQSSGEFVDTTDPIWPDLSVEQVLDSDGIISEVRIWAAAGIDGGEAPVVASLLRPRAEVPVRQIKVPIRASRLPVPYVLTFPPYQPAPGEKPTLQLWISTERRPEGKQDNYVVFGTSEHGGARSLMLNRQPTLYGPLAYEFIWRGTGWQAALEGSTPDRARLAGGLAASALAIAIAVLSHPAVSRALRITTRRGLTAFLSLAGQVQAALRLSQNDDPPRMSPGRTSAARRAFYVFPWLIPTFALLHYLSNNLLLFRVSDAIVVFAATMAAITIAFIVLRLICKTAAVAAVLTGLLGIAFFSYGHVYIALGDRADDRYLLGLGLPIILVLGALTVRRPALARRISTVLNFASVVLLAVPGYQIALHFYTAISVQPDQKSHELAAVEEIVAPARLQVSQNQLRDIYYIILDEYPRSGSPPEFDNGEFVQELENRGFYVAPQARSNYPESFMSIPTSLNMAYVSEDTHRDARKTRRLVEMADDHRLGRILKALGYRYLHVSSGWFFTKTSRNADEVVAFAPSGRIVSGLETTGPLSLAQAMRSSSRFATTFLRTTAAKPFLSHEFSVEHDGPYHSSHPFHTLDWLDFMKEIARIDRPRFVFAHLMRPHDPYSFDKSGNITLDEIGWRDDHDPTVPEAFYGQLFWLNGQVLEVIDAILDQYEEPPIIVIAGDHGHERHNPDISNDILAAFLLPDGGQSAVYPSITSVNHFRAILDYYFGLDLGLLEDKVYGPAS